MMDARKRKKGKADIEWTLYHGVRTMEDLTTICQSGVDCNDRRATAVARPWGMGGYFHVNAAQADKSCGTSRGEERHMMVMDCLVGTWGQGAPRLIESPTVNPGQVTGKRFDSCADDKKCPKTFVIFDGAQVRPMFLITYKLN